MRAIVRAAAGSGATLAAIWIVGVGFMEWLFDEAEGGEGLATMVIAIPVALLLFVIAPLLAGLAGGLMSRSLAAVVGSLAGFVAVAIGAVALSGGSSGNTSGLVAAAAVSVVLVLAGHFTGVVIRPKVVPI